MIVYFSGQFVPKEDVQISADDRGFLFADGAYEVIRSYGGRWFKAEEHFRRLARSLRELRITLPDMAHLEDVAEQLLEYNNLGDANALLYLQVTRGVAPRRHPFPDSGTPPTVYASVSSFKGSSEQWVNGVRIILVPDIRWARCDIKSVALLPNVLASQQAKECGAEEAVFVRNGLITEGTHTNVFAVFDGQLVTPPQTNHILAGVTRGAVIDLCSELGVPSGEAPIAEVQLGEASEILITSTTVEIAPVVQVDEWQVGDGKPGPVANRLRRAFREMVTALPRAAARD